MQCARGHALLHARVQVWNNALKRAHWRVVGQDPELAVDPGHDDHMLSRLFG